MRGPPMKVTVQYAIEFGKCDVSDWMPWQIELTPDEEAAYNDAVAREDHLNDVPELQDVLSRAYDEIEEHEAAVCKELGEDNILEDGCMLMVQFS